MQRETTIGRWCGWAIEACWVLALTLVPIYFSLFSARHFEPDKATTLRSLVLIAAAAGLIRAIEALSARGEAPAAPEAAAGMWGRFTAIPLALPALVYALVFLLTTATSVVRSVSFWGSYQRLQGAYTNLSYILLFMLILVTLRSRAQLERIITITLIAGVTAAGYGVLQHFQLDPLPWQGDVISRVASTMGNSIFVAAYLIMVAPLALYRLFAALGEAREAPPSASPRADWLWALARALLLLCGVLLLLSVIKFGAAVRTVDFRYWWVFPGAVVAATAVWWLLTTDFDRAGGRVPIWPGFVLLGFLLLFGAHFAFTASTTRQESLRAEDVPNAVDWWLWLLAAMGCGAGGYGLALFLPPREASPSRLSLAIGAAVSGAAALLVVVAIVFTQSRGPFLGLGAGLFVFFSLLLWTALRRARARGADRLAGRLRALLVGWVALSLLMAAFLVAFNLSDAPFFQRLREVPYVGRMGRLLELNSGTGLVRKLIWAGDEHGGGAIGLITANPVRALIGWGPESMFVAFNPFFPPALSTVEARGASPDRSHQAILDELVTKGLVGLASYLFLLISFAALAVRLLLRSQEWRWQLFYIATLSTVVCHVVEGLTGIPIVATLTLLWVTMAITVAGGALEGRYRLSLRPEPPPAPAPEEAPAAPERRRQAGAGGRRGAVARGSAARSRGAPRQQGRGQLSAPALLSYGALLLVALWLTWTVNLSPVYADMRFQEGQGLIDRAGLDLSNLVIVLDDYIQTVRSSPGEDFYYLSLGRALMTTSDALRARGVALGEPLSDASVRDVLGLSDIEAVAGFIQRGTPQSMMSYAEAVLLEAHRLNPLNKDHFANLGRLNNYWYSITGDPERLRQALSWYEQVAPIAPNDVTLINERAGVISELGDYAGQAGDSAQAQAQYEQAAELLRHSEQLDSRYADTYLRMGDLERARGGDLAVATDLYARAVDLSPTVAAPGMERVAEALAARPELLGKLRDAFAAASQRTEARLASLTAPADIRLVSSQVAQLQSTTGMLAIRAGDLGGAVAPYQRATALQPANAAYSQNYTLVLSDTMRYDEAIAEANRLIAVLQGSGQPEQAAEVQRLIEQVQAARN